MDSEAFKGMGDIERLEYIESLSRVLSPFEKMLFYEGVYFVWPGSNYLGFNINIKQDWGILYFYGTTLFAHGLSHEWKDTIELTFGDDLKNRNLEKIKHVHFYSYMKKIVEAYTQNPDKRFIIPHDQLVGLASRTDKNFLPQALNFYLLKVGGFSPENQHLRGDEGGLVQEEWLLQFKNGFHLTYKDAMEIIGAYGLSRDIAREEKEYWHAARAQSDKDSKITEVRIASRDILLLSSGEIKKIWNEKHPVEVKDKIVLDNLGYCAGAVYSNGQKLWFRRYGESPDIMEALEKDLNEDNADEMFNKDTKVVLMSTSYGSWRWDLEDVKRELVKRGVPEQNIIMLDSKSNPSLDGISVYLFPTGQVIIHKKNHDLGVVESIEYTENLGNLHEPLIRSRFDIEDIFNLKNEQIQRSREITQTSLAGQSIQKPAISQVQTVVEQSI